MFRRMFWLATNSDALCCKKGSGRPREQGAMVNLVLAGVQQNADSTGVSRLCSKRERILPFTFLRQPG